MKTLLSKKNYIIIAVVIVCVLGMAAIFFMGGNKEFKNHLSLGNKYLQEMKYEEAIVEFTAAFNLEPKNKDAAEGMETACLAYADSVLADVENVEIETLVKVSEVLMSSYEITQIETIHSKAEEIEQVIQEKEEVQAEEEAKAAEEKAKKEAEEEAKRLEEEKRKEEDEKKNEIISYYSWKVDQIVSDKFDLLMLDMLFQEKEEEIILIVYASGKANDEKFTFTINKDTEIGIVTEHLAQHWETGEWMAAADAYFGYNDFTGKEYDFSMEEGMPLYQEWLVEKERNIKPLKRAVEQSIEYINTNWDLAVDGTMVVREKLIILNAHVIVLHYMDENNEECCSFIGNVYNDGSVSIFRGFKYNSSGERVGEIDVDF